MDTGTSNIVSVDDGLFRYIATRPEDFAWTPDVRKQILARRAAMSGQLFFDSILQLGGMQDPTVLYPPKDLHNLKLLCDAIQSMPYESMRRECFIYYLLKQSQDGRDHAFANERVLSLQFVKLLDAYWELDMGINLENAIAKISDARIAKEYSSKIMDTLAIEPDSGPLIRKFVRTCKPRLREQSDMELYLIATAELSTVEAWKYQRTFPEGHPIKNSLFRKLLVWALTPKPKAEPLKQLVALPLSKYENAVLRDFAVNPPNELSPSSIEVVRDLVCVRLIQSANYAEAVRFDRQYPGFAAAPKGTWGAERRRIIKDIFSILPKYERNKLENEAAALEQDARMRRTSGASAGMSESSSSNLAASGSTDLGESWEDIGQRASKTASAPRNSFGAASAPLSRSSVRTTPTKPLFAPGGTGLPSRSARPPTQSTRTAANSSATSPARQTSPFVNPSPSPACVAHLSNKKTSHVDPVRANGIPNGEARTSAANARNAFFVPPEQPRSPPPEPVSTIRAAAAAAYASASPNRGGTSSRARLSTPPREETENVQSPLEEEEAITAPDAQAEVISSDPMIEEEREGRTERSGFGFSLFGFSTPAPAPSTRLTPSSGDGSPKNNRRKYQDEGAENQRKRMRVSLPGAFMSDDEQEQEQEPDLSSPASATVQRPAPRMPTRRTPSRTSSRRTTARKRSASPEDEIDSHPYSIPGTLIEEDENDDTFILPNGLAEPPKARRQRNGRENSEEADELGPLPPLRGRANVAASSGSMRTPRRSSRSVRGNSAEPEAQSTGRPVRRSSRLQSADVSPTAEHINRAEFKKEKKKSKNKEKERLPQDEKEIRPRKSTRTKGDGATATGHGSSKRR